MVELDGFLELTGSVIAYGCVLVPLKKFHAADGFFSQWCMSVAIVLVGFCGFAYSGFEEFYPVAMLGGTFWAVGNAMAVPIINRIGLGLGPMIWAATNCLTGWLLGTFGVFGIKPRPANNLWITGLGLLSVLVGGIMFCFVKNKKSDPFIDEFETPLPETSPLNDDSVLPTQRNKDKEPSKTDRIVGIALSLLAGMFYGCKIFPVVYIQDNKELFPTAPQNGTSYIFSHFFGVFVSCTVIFVGYCIVKKNKPVLPSEVAIPALVAGLFWAVATALLLNATAVISAAVTYPIATTVPGCIGACWSIFYFREIQGTRNLSLMAGAAALTIIGAVLIGVSK